jgi:type I restriction enzyme M protein
MDGKQDYDVLGFIYEYLISMFAANAGKKAGEFYTPHEVSVLMSEIVAGHLNGRSEIKIYDPTSGSGSLLINIGQSVSKYISDEDNIKYYAQELKENTYNLTRMNLVMRGIKPDNIVTRNGDTLEDDWPYFNENDPVNTYNPLYVDAVVSNPPYSQVWDPTNKETDPRYARFGLAPKGKADYAFLLHDLFHIKPDGIMTIVLPHGVLFRGGEEGGIRKNLIENNHIDTIIGLPANIFFGTGIPTIVMVLKQKRDNTDILIVDASKGFIKEGKNNKLRASDIKKIADVVTGRKESFKFSRVVSREEIRKNDYNLNIPRYVDSSEETESWDIYASMFGGIPLSEINTLSDYWTAFPNLKKDLFIESDIPYVQLKNINVKEMLQQHSDIIKFEEAFKNKFGDFSSYLKEQLILQMADIQISKEESVIANDIFSRMKEIPLINKYEAYQLLDDDWVNISIDLEIIRTEGFEATKKVDPNIIIKKKDGKDHEVQEGWIGHVIPFELIQETLLKEEADELKRIETRLAEIPNQYEEILDSLSEEEKESDICNETGDAFVVKEVIKKIKDLKGVTTQESVVLYDKLVKVAALLDSEREYKSEIKKKSAELQNHTKEVIENLSDDEVYLLLEKKWIEKLIENLFKLPDTNVDNLTNKIISISEKYRNTYSEIENQIQETEKELCDMIELLTGNEYDMKGLGEFKSLLLGK